MRFTINKTFLQIIALLGTMLFLNVSSVFAGGVPAIYWQLANEDRYVYRNDMDKMNWLEIRERRELNKTANQEVKTSGLKIYGDQLFAGRKWQNGEAPAGAVSMFVRDPNGRMSTVSGIKTGENAVQLPQDVRLNGRYLLGALYSPGKADVDGDGREETVYLSAKQMVRHYLNGGVTGKASVVYFDDPERMPLEIAPAINTAENRSGGNTQRPHKDYDMQVRYRGKPLAGARVVVRAMGSGWEKQFVTDSKGLFTIIPPDDRTDSSREWQTYLFMAAHHDRERAQFHNATLPVTVYKNRPEWYSKAMGFTFFAIIGTSVVLVILAGMSRRRKRRQQNSLAVFEKYRIKE